MDDEELQKRMLEINLTMHEFDAMFRVWDKRKADPLIVMSIGLVKFVAFSGELFDSETDYRMFLHKCMSQGYEMFKANQEEDEKPNYVH
jgi:hypothetical protein